MTKPRVLIPLLAVFVACTPARLNLDPASIQVPAAEALSEREIASIAAVANTVMVRGGQIGVERGETNSVRTFGELLVADYSSLNAELAGVLEASEILPEGHALATRLVAEGPANTSLLERLPAAEFNAAYIRRQEAMARWYLAILEYALIPSASSPRLRRHLEDARTTTEAHLAAALEMAPRL